MRSLICFGIVLIGLAALAPALGADVTRLELHQRADVVIDHQRVVGNLRAQAKRKGVVVHVPQLFVYFSDKSAAWHLQGTKRGFERELGLVYRHDRRERSMVRIGRLLERTLTPDNKPYTVNELPEADIYLLLYRSDDCDDCQQVAATLSQWLDEQPEMRAVWIDVWLGRHQAD